VLGLCVDSHKAKTYLIQNSALVSTLVIIIVFAAASTDIIFSITIIFFTSYLNTNYVSNFSDIT
jgi:hypothetical protein